MVYESETRRDRSRRFRAEYGGHKQVGTRPAIAIRSVAELAIVIPLTSNPGAKRFNGTVVLQPNGKNNLSKPSIALVFQLQPVDKSEIIKRIGALQRSEKITINEAMRDLFVL